jgi:putative peptidoglycan lipid II flippase
MAGWGLVVGSVLQLLLQLPVALRLLGRLRPSLRLTPAVSGVFLAFGPVVVARGVVQVSAYVDQWLASWLPSGSVAALGYAQTIYVLPVSLFGMSVAAASLPEMSAKAAFGVAPGGGKKAAVPEAARLELRRQLEGGFAQIAFFVVPSTAAFLFLGDRIVGALFQTGAFSRHDSVFVWSALAGSAIGLLAGTFGRLCSSTYYALRDTKSPLRFALARVALTTLLGYFAGLKLPGMLGVDPAWGVAGLTASAGVAGWAEFLLLRAGLRARIGPTRLPGGRLWRLWVSAIVASGTGFACGFGLDRALDPAGGAGGHPLAGALASLLPFALVYVCLAHFFGVPQASRLAKAVRR